MIDPLVLLGRNAIDFCTAWPHIGGMRVLVTGAGGSIGSVLCRRLAGLDPAALVMVDRDESGLHGTQLAMTGRALLDDRSTVLADIRDKMRMIRIFEEYRPDVVFHAAALKHQPLLERYPEEAMKTNVIGTRNVLLAAANVQVSKFVNVSTDKAADPTCVLGASKRVAERLVAWYGMRQMQSTTVGIVPYRYGNGMCTISARFGNVINSRGSVLSTFTAQLERRVPLTVTHADATRYFMTGREAANLLITAAHIGKNQQVLIPDMGKPVRIVDIANRLIAERGHGSIEYTGLRTGEKPDEDLFGYGERDHRPRHSLISQVKVPPLAPNFIDAMARQILNGEPSIGPHLMELARDRGSWSEPNAAHRSGRDR